MIENEYYYSKLDIFPHSGLTLHGRMTIYRKDTNEEVTSLNLRGENKERVETRLHERLKKYLLNASPPEDFGDRDSVDYILNLFLRFKQKSTDIKLYLIDNFENRTINKNKLNKVLEDLITNERGMYKSVGRLVAKLSEKEKQSLVMSPEDVYNNMMSDGCALDDARARSELFEYISNPSVEIKNIHTNHIKRCKNE